MLPAIRNSISFLLIVTVLIASVGFTITRYYCPVMDKTTVAGHQENCCCKGSIPQKDACCDLEKLLLKSEAFTDAHHSKSLHKQLSLAISPVVLWVLATFRVTAALTLEPVYLSPPPRSGRVIGILYQVFLI